MPQVEGWPVRPRQHPAACGREITDAAEGIHRRAREHGGVAGGGAGAAAGAASDRVILTQSADDDYKNITVPFLQGLKEAGYVEGQDVIVEYRYGENQIDRLPATCSRSDASERDDRHGALLDADMTADALILLERLLKHVESAAPRSWTSA
jgi:hypothetical protein